MRMLLLVVAAAVAGCSGPPRSRFPHVMIARAIPKAAKRLREYRQPQTAAAAEGPSTVITGQLVR